MPPLRVNASHAALLCSAAVSAPPDRILVTGANGHIGRRLLSHLAGAARAPAVRAVVRSTRAAEELRGLPAPRGTEVRTVDYRDADGLAQAAAGCIHALHLVGILKQTRHNRYVDAHDAACRALVAASARAGVRRIVALSILGADPDARNACLASRGRADTILLEGATPAVVLRLPMVLGPGDAASRALIAQARAPRTWLVRGGVARRQPIATDDVISALLAARVVPDLAGCALDLAGPESLSQRALVERTAALLGRTPHIRSVPLAAAWLLAAAAEIALADPPITRAMLEVLEQDNDIDPTPALTRLGIALTPLDECLRRCLTTDTARP
jgi:uncharacterized protein YbjT (DUF2867 family)